MTPEEYNQWKEFSQLAEFRLQEQSKLQRQTQEQVERDKYLRQLADLIVPKTEIVSLTRPSIFSEPWQGRREKQFQHLPGLSRGRLRTDGRTDGRMIGRWLLGHPGLGCTIASVIKLPWG
jgi:hypothetical protein